VSKTWKYNPITAPQTLELLRGKIATANNNSRNTTTTTTTNNNNNNMKNIVEMMMIMMMGLNSEGACHPCGFVVAK
jgi:hypothetical protein